jgi:hypothetical protein
MNDSTQTRIHYENTAAQLELSELWQKYIADLACGLFGSDEETGDLFIRNPQITVKDPLELFKAAKGGSAEGHLETSAGAKIAADSPEHRVWISQVRICLPLIEIERCGYITSQYGRLLGVLGAEYWNNKTEEYKIIWDNRTNAPVKDPYAIDIATLQQIGHMNKRLMMLGTISLTPFFSVSTEDMSRFDFIAKAWEKFTRFQLCTVTEIDKLFSGHHIVPKH